ncbi:hypothetical protein LDENG_00007170, partial [Lucifuga dentata]
MNVACGYSFTVHACSSTLVTRSNTLPSRRTLKNSRLVCKKDDVHVCIMCLRAIMNYQYGFNMVMSHPHAVNEIALSLNNRNPRSVQATRQLHKLHANSTSYTLIPQATRQLHKLH